MEEEKEEEKDVEKEGEQKEERVRRVWEYNIKEVGEEDYQESVRGDSKNIPKNYGK